MIDLHITRDMLDDGGVYQPSKSIEIDGSLTVEDGIPRVVVRGFIKAGGHIQAVWSIKAGGDIEAGLSIMAGGSIQAVWSIQAGGLIEAGQSIQAGWFIQAGESIKAGQSIQAGESINAGESIEAKTISTPLCIFAGLCSRQPPEPDEMEVRAEILQGTLAHGTHVPPGEPKTCPTSGREKGGDGADAHKLVLARLDSLIRRAVEVTIYEQDEDEGGDARYRLIVVSPECQREYVGADIGACLSAEMADGEGA